MTKKPNENEPARAQVLDLALRAQVHPNTARKALIEGVDSVKGTFLKERLREAIASMPSLAKK